MRLSLSLVVACWCLSPVLSFAENWTTYRGPQENGHTTAKNLPNEWSEQQNIAWKVPIRGRGWSSPVIWGNELWLTTASPDGKELWAICLDRQSGKTLFEEKLVDVAKPQYAHPYNSYASPTPCMEEGRIYLHWGSPATICLDTKTRKPIWTRTDLKCDHFRGAGSSPVIAGDLLILTFDGFDFQYVMALDKNTGKDVWRANRTYHDPKGNGDYKKAYSTPKVIDVAGKKLVVSPSAAYTCAYELETGKEVWKVKHGGMNAASLPIFEHGLLYTTSADGGDQLVAVKPDGTGDVTKSHVAWKSNKGIPNRSSLLPLGDYLFMVNSGRIATCMEAKTGKVLNTARLEGSSSKFVASPILSEGKIYVFDEDGMSFVFKADESLEVLGKNKLADGVMASPAAVDNSLYVRTKSHMYCIQKK
ncbi:MAG: PQQ-binding-like beta-propeller repeat protein [Zavarzinella sp.]